MPPKLLLMFLIFSRLAILNEINMTLFKSYFSSIIPINFSHWDLLVYDFNSIVSLSSFLSYILQLFEEDIEFDFVVKKNEERKFNDFIIEIISKYKIKKYEYKKLDEYNIDDEEL